MNSLGYDMHLLNVNEFSLHLIDSILPLYYNDEIIRFV
jgi:hypothetical protein